MAKACAYLCRQCRFIDGFGEFGEYLSNLAQEDSSIMVTRKEKNGGSTVNDNISSTVCSVVGGAILNKLSRARHKMHSMEIHFNHISSISATH